MRGIPTLQERMLEDIRDELRELRRALVAVAAGKTSRVVKFRTSPETRERTTTLKNPSERTVIQMRWCDRVERERNRWTLPDGCELGVQSAMQWEDVDVADVALGPVPIVPGHSFDKVNEFSARVTILNPMDPDTYDWRELRWLGVAEDA